jgi:hypothetical protein
MAKSFNANIGIFLRKKREAKGLSLRDVDYLSRGKINFVKLWQWEKRDADVKFGAMVVLSNILEFSMQECADFVNERLVGENKDENTMRIY